MSLETVVEDIRDEARARAEEIREEAEREAERIVEEAEREADQLREEARAEAEREIDRERDQKISSAKLEAKQRRLEARRDVLEGVREEVADRIAALSGDQREELTRVLLEDAAVEFEGEDDVVVSGRHDDEDLLRSILEDYPGFEYGGHVDCLGGVVVESEGSRLRVRNTFDAVLEDVWEDELRSVTSRLFEDDT